MDGADVLASVCSALGSRSRAVMMLALVDGEPHSASDLALTAEVAPATASSHLGSLLDAGLVSVESSGKQRLYRIADGEVASVIEQMLSLRPGRDGRPRERSMMRLARTCYDHLAGLVAVSMTRSLVERGLMATAGSDFEVSDEGREFFEGWGVDVAEAVRQKRLFARQCVDWTEREPHIAGALGAAIAARALELRWFERVPGTRAPVVTEGGQDGLRRWFDVDLRELMFPPMPDRSVRKAGGIRRS